MNPITKGYLRLPAPALRLSTVRVKSAPRFQPPPRLGNWEYFTVPEEQGTNPWCAAYAMCSIAQAAAWRKFGYPVQFDEARVYAAAKRLDGDGQDGTSLESVITAFEQVHGAKIEAHLTEDAGDMPWIVHQYGAALIGMQIDEGWNDPRPDDGRIIPAGKSLGGHAVDLSWYKNPEEVNGGPNWWGRDWGMQGYWSMGFSDFAKQFVYGYALRINFGGVP